MKICPNCKQSFSDDLVFCMNDGTVLENSATSFSGDMPTVVVSKIPPKNETKDSNKTFYAVIGAMAVIIVGLSAIVFFMISDAKNEPKTENKTSENQTPNTPQISPTANQNQIITVEKTPVKTAPITADAAQSLINHWQTAQNNKNFNAYRSCYASQFSGIKRTKSGSETQMNYSQWMNDRQKMMKNIISVGVENLQITVEGDTATAKFIQNFQSANYEDRGQKIIKMKMFDDSAKIIFEELKYSY